tara:strand:- start:3834 stop:4214 length:381 start_codon:yes stop_codon:yes gene_type:complete
MGVKTVNISFPFESSPVGDFLRLNSTSKRAIKSDLTHLLLTRKGDRLYNPEFGSGLYDFIFEQVDSTTISDIKTELETNIARFIPGVIVNELKVTPDPDNHHIKVNLDYTINNMSLRESDNIEIIL